MFARGLQAPSPFFRNGEMFCGYSLGNTRFLLAPFFQSKGLVGTLWHPTHQKRKTSANFPAQPGRVGGSREASENGKSETSQKGKT